MLPSEEQFCEQMKTLDARLSDTFVCYDSFGMAAAPRVAWMLRTFGAKNVFILNGTFDKWLAEKLPISKGIESSDPFKRTRPVVHGPAFDYKLNTGVVETYKTIMGKTLIDTRKGKIYKKGHIPFSFNVPTSNVL